MGNLKISTKGRYALRLMIDLAINDDGKCIRIRDIAKRQEISDKYLEQIISILNRAGYIKSVRGPQGGHRLAKHPSGGDDIKIDRRKFKSSCLLR